MITNKVQVMSGVTDIDKNVSPLLISMRLIGILGSTSREQCLSWLSLCYRFIIYLFSVAVHGVILYDVFYLYFTYKNSNHILIIWVALINCVTKATHSVGIHSILFFVFNGHWNRLKESINKTENFLGLPKIDYSKLWKLCFLGVVYIILMVSD